MLKILFTNLTERFGYIVKKNEAKDKLEQAKGLVIDSISETMDLYGVTPSVGRLYGTMYFHIEPMTLDEMKDELAMSKPSMSTAVKKLQENEMVQKTWLKGSRRDCYIAEKDFFNNFLHFFTKKWEKEVTVNLNASDKAIAMFEEILNDPDATDEIKEQAKIYIKQIDESKVYYTWLSRLVDGVKSGEIYKYFPKELGSNKNKE